MINTEADWVKVGDIVKDSGVGPGVVTGFTERGYPQVNHVACAWIEFEDGSMWDPHNVRERHLNERKKADEHAA